MVTSESAIGVMDSGVGGISVLNALRRLMPQENFVYLSDSAHAPYGRRTEGEILETVVNNAERLVFMGCKALVIACNTATAVAVPFLRKRFLHVPVVGLEPAVRPALSYAMEAGGDVLVLATAVTVREERFMGLCLRSCMTLARESEGKLFPDLYALSVQGTVDFVERKAGCSSEHTDYLRSRFLTYADKRFSAVVLGCTHFPFAVKSISEAIGYPVRFFDGADGAARRVKYLLEKNNITRSAHCVEKGWVEWLDTGEWLGFAEKLRFFGRMGTV